MLKISLLVTLLFCSACSSIQKPFFWEATKNGKTSYILGTIHYGVPYENLPSYVTDKIDTSNVVLVEIQDDEEKPENQSSSYLIQKSLVQKKDTDKPLSVQISPQAYKFVQEKLKNKYPNLDNLSPAGVAILLYTETQSQKKIMVSNYEYQQLNSAWGMDYNITVDARKAKKYVESLDSESQYWQDSFRQCYFKTSLRNIEKMARGEKVAFSYTEYAQMLELMKAYKTGDEKILESTYIAVSDRETDKCILEDRNKEWLPKITNAHHNNAPVFIAVGVAHMVVEPNSLKKLLEEKGYLVERVTQKK